MIITIFNLYDNAINNLNVYDNNYFVGYFQLM